MIILPDLKFFTITVFLYSVYIVLLLENFKKNDYDNAVNSLNYGMWKICINTCT